MNLEAKNHFFFFFATFLPFFGAAASFFVFFAALGFVPFVAFGPIPTQLSTVSTASLILLFFFAMFAPLKKRGEGCTISLWQICAYPQMKWLRR